jgi:DNA mismatch repair protein MutL
LQSQKLLLPESFQATTQQMASFKEYTDIIEKLGLEIVSWGPKTIAIQSFPVLLGKAKPVEFVQDMLDMLADKGKGFDAEQLLDEVINMAACKAAIKAGDKLNADEIEQLLADRHDCPLSGRCAHGRPTSINFTLSELEKQFKRT